MAVATLPQLPATIPQLQPHALLTPLCPTLWRFYLVLYDYYITKLVRLVLFFAYCNASQGLSLLTKHFLPYCRLKENQKREELQSARKHVKHEHIFLEITEA